MALPVPQWVAAEGKAPTNRPVRSHTAVEGLPGVALAIITWLFLPTYPQARNRIFSDRERSILIARKARESTNEVNTGVDWKAVRYAFLDWRVYGTGLVCFCINVNISSVTGFLPSIIKLMGYTAARVCKVCLTYPVGHLLMPQRLSSSLFPHTPSLLWCAWAPVSPLTSSNTEGEQTVFGDALEAQHT